MSLSSVCRTSHVVVVLKKIDSQTPNWSNLINKSEAITCIYMDVMQCWIGELGGVFWMLKSSRRQQWELLNYWCSHSWFVCEGFLNWWFKWYLKWTPDSFCFVFGKIDCWCFKLQSRFEEEKSSETALLVATVVFLLLLLLLLSLFEALNLELSFWIPWSEFWEEVVV